MDGILQFGKYDGKLYSKVLEEDVSYGEWALKRLKNSSAKCQVDFYNFVRANIDHYRKLAEEKYLKDVDLKKAWYNDPRASLLLSYGLDPSLEDPLEKNLKYLIGLSVDEISPRRFIQSLNGSAVEGWLGSSIDIQAMKTDDLILALSEFVIQYKGRSYYIREDILNTALQLRDLWDDNRETDQWYSNIDQPSKIILEEYLYPFDKPLKSKKTKTPRGRWLLYFDNRITDKAKLTELDRCYQILKDNYDSISQDYIFRASTKKCRDVTYGKGMIEIFCNEEDRDKIIRKIDDLLYLDMKIGWRLWSESSSKYHYEPKLYREKESMKESIYRGSTNDPVISIKDLEIFLENSNKSMVKDLKDILEREILFDRLKNETSSLVEC